ncbi:MAG: fused MFS/spermidine synthase [Candidatus Krumholzibacteriia bacterium]
MLGFYLYLAVTVSGASILAIEILGTRIIGPFYGVSLYLWSALIGVTLAALAVGYALGGRWADREPRVDRLAGLMGLAGLWIVLVPWLRHPVLGVTQELGLRVAVLAAATVLFFPPLLLLGMISPYAIRLKTRSVAEVGRTAGNLFAVSTVASVVAAVAVGFFLIPALGVGWLTFAVGILLIMTSLLGLSLQGRRRAAAAALIALVVAAAGAAWNTPAEQAQRERGVLAVADSPYAELRVIERDGVRYLLVDGVTHSAVDVDTGESPFEYVHVLDMAGDIFHEPGRMLLVGLGAGSLARSYAERGWEVDAVEIDPAVTRLARQYFGFGPQDARVHHLDGRRYLQETVHRYDLVILDAFGSGAIPFHLVTREAFAAVADILTPGGVVALNIWAVGWHDVIVPGVTATLETSFEHVLALPTVEPPDQLGNLIMLASDRELDLVEEPPVPEYRFSAAYDRAHAWDNRFRPDTEGVAVITDEHNPVDLWSDRINLVARRHMHAYFAERGVTW